MLHKIRNGIYALSENNADLTSKLIVAVHPYFQDPDNFSAIPTKEQSSIRPGSEKFKEYLEYRTRFTDLVKTHEGPMITLETFDAFKRTERKYRKLGRTDDTFLIRTVSNGTSLIETNWGDVFGFLIQFESRPYCLVGGYLWSNFGGCLGAVARRFKERELEFGAIKGMTFS